MIVVADTNELLRHFRSDTLTEVRHCLLNMDRATLPDAMAAPSLSFDYVRPGDVLYTPTGRCGWSEFDCQAAAETWTSLSGAELTWTEDHSSILRVRLLPLDKTDGVLDLSDDEEIPSAHVEISDTEEVCSPVQAMQPVDRQNNAPQTTPLSAVLTSVVAPSSPAQESCKIGKRFFKYGVCPHHRVARQPYVYQSGRHGGRCHFVCQKFWVKDASGRRTCFHSVPCPRERLQDMPKWTQDANAREGGAEAKEYARTAAMAVTEWNPALSLLLSCNVQGMDGIHGNGKRRAKLIGTNIQNKTKWWSCLQFTFLKGTYRGLNLQQLLLILQTFYSIHPERHGRAPAYHTLCKSLGCKWANSSKLTRKILQEYHVQIFGLAQRPDDAGNGLRVHVFPLSLANTSLRAASPVEDLVRVRACGGMQSINTAKCDALVSDGARVYPSVADSLGVPHYHVSHGAGVWRKMFRRRRKPAIQAHSGSIDNFWKQLQECMPAMLAKSVAGSPPQANPELMSYVFQFVLRYHHEGNMLSLMRLLGKFLCEKHFAHQDWC
ncbi:unnamed protein product [Symbiodinium natans]|uniref:Uncharacterized protein n=1 Tax=Symbiodinium natans TaxID=878477 RepID=A0A812HLR1_9DINO|nr:unnamed protein product [Symbiodinium natans]